jgi:hypothetical protein
MIPEDNEPSMSEIMSTYLVLGKRLRELREKFPYREVKRQGGWVLLYQPT